MVLSIMFSFKHKYKYNTSLKILSGKNHHETPCVPQLMSWQLISKLDQLILFLDGLSASFLLLLVVNDVFVIILVLVKVEVCKTSFPEAVG